MNILIVGINPPQKAIKRNGVAFPTECKSRKTLDTWLKPIVKLAAEVYRVEVQFYYANVSDTYTDGNRIPDVTTNDKLRLKQLCSDFNRVVACGKLPASVLSELGIEHLEILHPSGLSRALNNPQTVQNLKLRLRNYIINGIITKENESLISTNP